MATRESVLITEHVRVPMADGVSLSARLWLPEHTTADRVPVVLEYIPYRKRDLYRAHDDAWGRVLAGQGIAFARIDVRGTGDSEGTITDEYTEQELTDGEACIAWLARQRWCNGRVGMRGISWGAINTLQIAARRPAALKAVMPISGSDNRYTDDAHYLGGLLGKPNLDWGVMFRAVLAGPPDPEVAGDGWFDLWQERLGATHPVIAEWMRHQTFDEYWQRGSVGLDYAAIRCPVYLVAGWYDTYSNFVGRTLDALDVPKKGLIGPWGHTYPDTASPGGLDWAAEEVRWWRQWLLDEDTGIMAEPLLRVFMPYATPRQVLPEPVSGRWIAESRWPPPRQSIERFWLNPASLDAEPTAGETMTWTAVEPVGFARAEWLDILPEEQSRDDAHSLVFDSAPLREDLEILGYPAVLLRLTADRPAAAIAARLLEVDAKGRSWLVSYGILNLSHRTGHANPQPVDPGAPMEVRLTLYMTAHRFRRGHRLRLALSDGLWPLTVPIPGVVTLQMASGISVLELPVRPPEAEAVDFLLAQSTVPAARPPAMLPEVVRQADGSYRYAGGQPAFSYAIPEVDTTLSGESSFECVLRRNRTSRWQQDVRRSWQRADWHCEVAVGCEIEAGMDTFSVREYTRAYRSCALIFERDETVEMPRRLL